MIQENNEYLFTIDNDHISSLVLFDLTEEECEDIANELDYRLDSIIASIAREYRRNHPNITNQCEVIALLAQQEWVNDYAVTTGNVEFEVQDALDKYDLSELPPYASDLHDKGALDCGDALFATSVSLGLVEDWDGPFALYINDEQYEWYMDDRVLKEYGYEPRDNNE